MLERLRLFRPAALLDTHTFLQWLTRWRRSHTKFPTTLTDEERAQCEKLIETHPQFFGDS
jgi:hypothetical protein